MSEMLTIRVSGLGHTLNFGLDSSTKVKDLKESIYNKTNIPPQYQRLLARGTQLDARTNTNTDNLTLEEASVKNRQKIMLMHNARYAQEKESYEKLQEIEKEIEELNEKSSELAKKVKSELVTRICCKLDEVELNREFVELRAKRKELIQKAENIDK